MKKIMSILIAALLVTGGLSAQDQTRDQQRERLQMYLMLKDGKMYQVQDQEQVQLREQLRLESGLVVNPDGSYQFKNEQQRRLKNGECLDMMGNHFKSQQEMQLRVRAMAQEHLMFQDGELYRIRNQEKIQLQEKVRLENGDVIDPDGTCHPNKGAMFRMKEGECMDMSGKRYESQERFHQKMEQQMNKEMKMEKGKGNKPEKDKKSGKKGGKN